MSPEGLVILLSLLFELERRRDRRQRERGKQPRPSRDKENSQSSDRKRDLLLGERISTQNLGDVGSSTSGEVWDFGVEFGLGEGGENEGKFVKRKG